MKRRCLTSLVLLVFLCVSYTVVYAEKIELIYDGGTHLYDYIPINLYINGQLTETTVMPPVQINSNVLVPAREVFEKMGAKVDWKNQENKVYLTRGDELIVLEMDSKEAWVNGETRTLDIPAKLINKKVMIPIRFMSEALGFNVKWVSESKSIVISEPAKEEPLNESNLISGQQGQTEKNEVEQGNGVQNNNGVENSNEAINNKVENDNQVVNNNEAPNGSDINSGNDTMLNANFKHITYNEELNAIILDKAVGLNVTDLSVEEDIYKRQIKVTLPQNEIDFYGQGVWSDDTKAIKKIAINHYSYTELVLTTATVKALNIYELDGKIVLQCVKPKEKYKKIVLLDPGHGAHDNGTSYGSLLEKNFTLNLGKGLFELLQQDPDIKVYMTRRDDTFLKLMERVQLSNEINPDLFISIHINSVESSGPNGTETYYMPKKDTRNNIFAKMVQKALVKNFETKDRGVKENTYTVINYTNDPAILIEIGFLSNEKDRQMMTSSDFVGKYASTVYHCILDYYNQGLNID